MMHGFIARAKAHTQASLSLYVACGVGVAIAWSVSSIVPVLSSLVSEWKPPVSRPVSAYPAPAGPEAVVVCRVTSGVCEMRSGLKESLSSSLPWSLPAPLPGLDELIARRKAARGDDGPAARVLSPQEIESARQARIDSVAYLSEPQKLALMQASPTMRHQAIWHALRRQYDVPPFTLSTFIELRELGLVHKPEGKTFHSVLPLASATADAVADALVQHHDLHEPYILHGATHKATVPVFCTCGWSAAIVAGNNMQSKAGRAFGAHMRKIGGLRQFGKAMEPA